MSKLFALENLDGDVVAGELEVTPEMGEAADVQVAVDEEVAEVGEATVAIDEGMGAADQLEEVEEVVAAAAEGEGLDPVAAEAIRIAVEAICARVGANPKAVYNLYATENFQSASGRKSNTKIALEGVSDFLKDMWKKIKAALQRLWDKARQFWDDHVSSLGRIKKALMSAKDRLSKTTGKLKDKAHLEDAPGYLAEAFGFDKDISVASIKTVVKTHAALTKTSDAINAEIEGLNSAAEAALKADQPTFDAIQSLLEKESGKTFAYGSANAPMVGGVHVKFTFEVEKDEGIINIDTEHDKVTRESKLGVALSDKAAVQDLIKETIYVIDDTIRYRDKTAKMNEAFNKFMLSMEKRLNELSAGLSADKTKDMRKIMKVAYKANSKYPQVNAELLSFNVKLGKAVLGYVGLCMKHYK